MHDKKKFKVISFYEFIYIDNIEQLKIKLYEFLKNNHTKGTVLLASEGINATLSCEEKYHFKVLEFIKKTLKKKINYKIHNYYEHAFLRLKVKIKKEIIKLNQKNISPKKLTGIYVNPEKWDQLIKDKNVITIDTRNYYESEIGTFKGSLQVNSLNFTQFPSWVKKNEKNLKGKKIAMFCTGGIRCEKASSYLINKGFKDVFQLDGGVVSYLKTTKNKRKSWIGECFVFDERVSLSEKLLRGNHEQCFACRSAISKKEKNSSDYKEGVYCPKCKNQTSQEKKMRFEERNRQMKIAKRKGIKHLGT